MRGGTNGEIYELHTRGSGTEQIASLSAEAVLSKAISRACAASRERQEGEWEISVLPKIKGGFAEHLYTVKTDSNRIVTVEVAR